MPFEKEHTFPSIICQYWLLCLLVWGSGMSVWGQIPQKTDFQPYYHFRHIGSEEGLLAQDIRQIIQDKQGFLWLATNNGLVRYDGHHFKNYNHEPANVWSLSSNTIRSMVEDSRGWLWVITEDEVLHCMDRKKEIFYRFGQVENTQSTLPGEELGEIAEDHVGRIWIRGNRGLICLGFWESISDEESLFPLTDTANHHYAYSIHLLSDFATKQNEDPREEYSFSSENSLLLDSKGNIWIDSHKGVFRFSLSPSWGIGVEPKDSLAPYQRYFYPYHSMGDTLWETSSDYYPYSAIFEDREQKLWMVNEIGVYNYQHDVDQFLFYPFHDKLKHNAIVQHKGGGIEVTDASHKSLWFADVYWGASIYDHKNKRLLQGDKSFEGAQFGVNAILQDRSGLVWLGTFWQGLYQYDPQVSRFLSYHPKLQALHKRTNINLRFVKEDSKQNLWLATDTLYRCDRQSGKFEAILLPGEYDGDRVWKFKNDLLEASNGHIWVAGEYLGLDEYDPETKQFFSHQILSEIHVFSNLIEGHDGHIWAIATDHHLYKIHPISKQITSYNIPPATSLFFPYILYQDKAGIIWIGTQEGLYKFNEQTSETIYYGKKQGLKREGINGIVEDSQDPSRFLWLSTKGGGLIRMDQIEEEFKGFNTGDGLVSNQLFSLIMDDNNRLWMSSDRGISSFDPITEEFRNYDSRDGLATDDFSSIYGGKTYKNAKGELFFSGSNGFVIFDPDELYDNPYPPDVAITDFQIRYQSVSVKDENTPLKAEISQAKSVVLPYEDNSISLTFSALQYHASEKNQYACMLEGYDNDWLNLGTQRQAHYTGIPPGTYTFKVKAANADGLWNEETTNLTITILPPWWRTWWAYLIYFTLIAVTIYSIYAFIKRRWELKGQLKTKQEEAQRLQELDRFKSDLYANITHEFRTPLTIILGIAGQLNPKLEETGKVGVNMIRRNARQLLRLINQMLDLSKLESRSLSTDYIQADIILYLRYLVESFNSLAEIKEVSLTFDTDLQELIMDYDADKLLKIVSNILSNAIKFTPSGGEIAMVLEIKNPSKKQTLNATGEPLQYLMIKISDTGPGISPDQLPFVFDRFYQTDATTTRKGEGTGIGLALTRELVTLLGGEIEVESILEEGTTFYTYLPIHTVAIQEEPDISEGAIEEQMVGVNQHIPIPTDTPSPVPSEKDLLLIIEDNPDVVYYMETCLSSTYRVETAPNGQLGIEKALDLIPDLIISDVMMPEKDGFEVCHTLKQDERSSHIPIILLTAKAEVGDRIIGFQQGADDYLAKPFDETELLARVQNLISLRKLLREQFKEANVLKPSAISVSSVDQVFLEKALMIVEEGMGEESFGVAQLCEEIGMSQPQLHRKLKALVDQSPSQFISSIRLQRATSLIEQQAGSLSEIAYQVGFSSQAYFSRSFQKKYGKSPSEYRKTL